VEDAGNRALQPAHPINPQRVAWELSPRLAHDTFITGDSGSCASWYARDLKVRRGMMCSLSGGPASMGAAVPYALAAKFAHPARPVVALVGDGAMQTNNMAELIGLKGIYCDTAAGVGAAWDAALAADRPVVLEFKTDPDVPPLPAHMSLEQARNFLGAIMEGDPRERSMLAGVARQVLSALLPGDKRNDQAARPSTGPRAPPSLP
jgi:thiamine pyrophosphate-dependent acetolactate synthase large subunit-like protein